MTEKNIRTGRRRHPFRVMEIRFQMLALAFCCAISLHPAQAGASDLLRMSDRFDEMDRDEMGSILSKADQCTSERDFNCAEKKLRDAKKLVNDSKSKAALKRSEDLLLAEKTRDKEEKRIIAQRKYEEEQRIRKEEERIAYEEQRMRDAEYQAQREENERIDRNNKIAVYGAALGQVLRPQPNTRVAEPARPRQIDQQRSYADLANERARLEQARRENTTQSSAPQYQPAQRTQTAPVQQAQTRAPERATERVQLADAAKPQKKVVVNDNAEDGCVEAIGWCSTAPTLQMKNGTGRLEFKNTCPFRVYAHFYVGTKDGKPSSGASGVAAGGNYTWSAQGATGSSFIRVIGSPSPSKDWVCYGKNPGGFTAGDATLER